VSRGEISGVRQALALSGVVFTTEAYATWQTEIENAPHKMYEPIRKRFETGRAYSGVQFVRAWQQLGAIRKDWARQVAGFDAVIMPSSAILPPNMEKLAADEDFYVTENLLALRNTRIGNLMNAAALTLPTGTPSCGIMLLAPANGEERLLRLGAAAEKALA